MNVIKTPQPKTIELGDKTYTLPVFDINLMADIEEAFDCDIGEITDIINKRKATNVRKLLWIFLKESGMTLEDVGKLITIQNMSEVSTKITEVMLGE